MRIIAFAGPKGAGKDSAARYLLARNPLLKTTLFRQFNFAETLKLMVELGFGFTQQELNDPALKEVVVDRWPFKCPRDILQNFANLCRTMYAPDIWVRAWERKVKMFGNEKNCIIVTDLRHPEEITKLRELGAKIIYVYNAKVEEKRKEGIASGDPLWTDSSESFAEHIRSIADYELYNDGESYETLYANTQIAITHLYGDWKDWQEQAIPEPTLKILKNTEIQ